jgi:flagellar hook capping protein FlgD
VSGTTSVRLGAQTRLTPAVTVGETPYAEAPMQFSAARGIVRQAGTDYPRTTPFQLVDRGVVTRTLPRADIFSDPPRVSGPYAAVGGRIYRVDGTLALDLSADNNGLPALYGKTVVYQSGGAVLVRDVEKPAASPTTLASTGVCDQNGNCGDSLAAWYDTVAWERLDGTIVVHTLSTGRNRVVDPGGGGPWDLRLSDLAMSWRTVDGSKVLDLRSRTSRPVTLAGLTNAAVDGHLVAGIDAESFRVVVRPLPFGSTRKTPVRLIGVLAPAAFTPGTTWSPQLDLTEPATGVTVTIRSGTTVVRRLTGTAPDGSIRDLTWDGRNTAGARVAAGRYSYRLTATAADGEGALTPVAGSVTVR